MMKCISRQEGGVDRLLVGVNDLRDECVLKEKESKLIGDLGFK